MILLWCLLTAAAAHKVVDSNEDIPPPAFNTTTLYPVPPANENKTKDDTKQNIANSWTKDDTKQNTANSWTKDDTKQKTVTTNSWTKKDQKQNTATSWKIETTFDSGEKKGKYNSEEKDKTDNKTSKEFKPSPHLGSFFDEENLELQVTPTKQTFDPYSSVIKKPPLGFVGSLKQKSPKETFKNHFPYKFESAIYTRAKDKEDWHPTHGPSSGSTSGPQQDSKPTAEVPVSVPAGGLYQLPDAFKEKPGSSGDDEDFGLEFSDATKVTGLKKRPNPWKKLLHLLTALIPVGIIISALTPNVITLESTANLGPHHSQHILRRAGIVGADDVTRLPPISDRCRRRLLCELHSENHYGTTRSRRAKPCHRIPCEDPDAMGKTLQWLLSQQQPYGDHLKLHI